jgi:gamma-glutamylcyclotransferase (GGCT)/AIG2-like uncharacterized protein YtfP
MSELARLCVYGSLKRGFGNNRLLQSATFVSPCTFKGTMYSMGGFPAVSLHGDTDIAGEIFEVDEATLHRCDQLEGHPDWYLRQKIETSSGPAWVYTQDADQQLSNLPIVKSGEWT